MNRTISEPLSRNDVIDLLSLVAATDGHARSQLDVDLWAGAAARGRWSVGQAAAAVQAVCDEFTGFRIMPGHISERIRLDRRMPASHAENEGPRQIEAASASAGDANRAAAVAEFVALQARKKAMQAPSRRELEEEAAAAHRAAEEIRQARWSAVDACDMCDREGLKLGVVGGFVVVCDHVPVSAEVDKNALETADTAEVDQRMSA